MSKAKTLRALSMIQLGLSTAAAAAAAAADEQADPAEITQAIRTTRYLVVNSHDKNNPMIASAPDDVVVVEYGWDAASEAWRNQLMADLGVSISALPSVIAWRDAYDVTDEDGTRTVPAGFAVHAIRDRRDYEWLGGAAPADRTEHPDKWARRAAVPPAPKVAP
jgi:hypothetical protein